MEKQKYSIYALICEFDSNQVGEDLAEYFFPNFSSDEFEIAKNAFIKIKRFIPDFEKNDTEGISEISKYLVLISIMNNLKDKELKEYAAYATNDFNEARTQWQEICSKIKDILPGE